MQDPNPFICEQILTRCLGDGALPECQNCIKSKRTCERSGEAIPKYIIHTADPDLQSMFYRALHRFHFKVYI